MVVGVVGIVERNSLNKLIGSVEILARSRKTKT